METVQLKVNATVVAANRRALNNVGKSFGGQFFRANREETNLRQAEDVINSENNNNLDLVTNRSPFRYKIVGTDIVAVEVGEDAEGASQVYINRGRKKQVGDKVFSQEAIIPVTGDMRLDSDASDDTILAEALKGDKSKIYGALGYFILPTDLVVDFLPIVGYSDDLAALMIALHAVATNITPEIKAQAKAKLAKWFGEKSQKKIDGMI